MADTNNEATSPAPAALIVKGIPVGVPVPVDAELDPDSPNPVSNEAVCDLLENKLLSLVKIASTNVSGSIGGQELKVVSNPPKPVDTNYNWYILSVYVASGAHAISSVSLSGFYVLNRGSGTDTYNCTVNWIGILKSIEFSETTT